MYVLVPTWLFAAVVVLLALNLVVDSLRLFARHHDHLIPHTPRRARG